MWYVIVAGVGLVLGVGLLIWALKERSARHKAEKESLNIGLRNIMLTQQNAALAKATEKHKEHEQRQEDQMEVLRKVIDGLRERLVSCQDPQAVTEWLDSEMADNDV
jgi:hypothetical protein